jgi:Tannase and feruloyl esterase
MGIEGGRLAKRGTAAEPGMAIFVLSWLFPGRVAGLRSRHGPVPNDPLETLVSWVEQGIAPGALPTTRTGEDDVEVSRDLCPCPQKLVYQEGDVNPASSLRTSRYTGIVAANEDPIVSTDKSARIATCSHSY